MAPAGLRAEAVTFVPACYLGQRSDPMPTCPTFMPHVHYPPASAILHDLCCKVSLIPSFANAPSALSIVSQHFPPQQGLAVALDEGGRTTLPIGSIAHAKTPPRYQGFVTNEGGASLSPGFFNAFGRMRAISMFAKVVSLGWAVNKL